VNVVNRCGPCRGEVGTSGGQYQCAHAVTADGHELQRYNKSTSIATTTTTTTRTSTTTTAGTMSTIDASDNDNVDNVATTPPSTISTTTTTTPAAMVTTSTITFSLSAHRQLIVSRNNIAIGDENTRINLRPELWAKLREVTNNVDVAIERLVKKDENVFYFHQLCGTWFVTVRSGVWCVNIRQHYHSPPTSTHIDGVDDDILLFHADTSDGDILYLKPSFGLSLAFKSGVC